MIIPVLGKRLQDKFDKIDGRWTNRRWLIEKEIDPETFVKLSVPIIFLCIQRKEPMVKTAIRAGNAVRKHYKQFDKTEYSLGAGLMLLECFIEEGVLKWFETNTDTSKHSAYYVQVKDWNKWKSLKEEIATDDETLPFDGWPCRNTDWYEGYSDSGLPFIRDGHADAIAAVSTETHGLLMGAVNKLQNTEYRINSRLYGVWKSLRNEAKDKKFTGKSPFKFVGETNRQRATSYIIEADTIEMMVDRLIDEPIHHTYNCDFRGRIYNTTVFLEEQASDQAKALLQYSASSPLGDTGLQWLMIHAANVWGNDKISLEKRIEFVEENMHDYILYARDPLGNRGWMEADKAWSFLMCCMEFEEIANWCENGFDYEAFPSKVICYIDGSNNGIQHLVSMSRDDVAAPYVNLVKTDQGGEAVPGDIYMYVAGKVWEKIQTMAGDASKDVVSSYPTVKKEFFRITKKIDSAKTTPEKRELYDELATFKSTLGDSRDVAKYAALFWNQFKDDPKLQRKMVKRNVMTIGYGATKGGMGQQFKDDSPDMHEDCRWIPGGWHFWIGALVFDTCYEYLLGPAMMLTMFRDLAEHENGLDRFLTYNTPFTNFPVIQNYKKAKTKRSEFLFCGKIIRPCYVMTEEKSINKQKQLSSTAPNVTHSLDAAHLTMVVAESPFEVTTIHDSFGCHAGDMGQLFAITREQFLKLYKENPLDNILGQVGCNHLLPTMGKWEPSEILDSDFAFC